MLNRARMVTTTRINEAVDQFRKRFYTEIAGQAEIYLEKRQEALSYIQQAQTTGEPATLEDYPFMQQELGKTAETPWQLAQIWLYMSTQFKSLGTITEGIRIAANTAVQLAPDVEQVEAAEMQFYTALRAIPV